MAQEERRPRLSTGQRIRWLMEERGLKPRDVWPDSGASESAFYLYTHDRRDLPGPVAAKIAGRLSTTTDFLLGLTEDPGDSSKARDRSELLLADEALALTG